MTENVDRLRQQIDRGLAADKVDVADPAAAPLGSDDEAAGRPPSRRRIRLAWRHEIAERPQSDGDDIGVALYLAVIGGWCAAFVMAALL